MSPPAQILVISPSEAIRASAAELALSMPDCHIDCEIGNLLSGVELAQQSLARDYDVVVARGQTAEMIRSTVDIPVVTIPISFYEVLHAIRLAQNFHVPFAVVGFASITDCAAKINDLLQLNLNICTLQNTAEADKQIELLKAAGYQMVVSGMSIDHLVRRAGLTSITITTSRDSVLSSLQVAAGMGKSLRSQKDSRRFFYRLACLNESRILVYNADKQLVFSNISGEEQEYDASLALRELHFSSRDVSVIKKTHQGMLITMHRSHFQNAGQEYTAFAFSSQPIPLDLSKPCLHVYTRDSALDTFLRHYPDFSDNAVLPCQSPLTLEQMSQPGMPILLFGEAGTGKSQVAANIFLNGPYRDRPYYVINFRQITNKDWTFFTTNINSPFYEKRSTFLLQGLEELTDARLQILGELLRDVDFCRDNIACLSYVTRPNGTFSPAVSALINLLGCAAVRLVPLRERPESLEMLFNLYINTANLELEKNVIGLSPEARRILCHYSWPCNLIQLKRVILQAVAASPSAVIPENIVQGILDNERIHAESGTALPTLLDPDKTLAELECDIAAAVLQEVKGNQTKAAARLGISRTTFWRLINRRTS